MFNDSGFALKIGITLCWWKRGGMLGICLLFNNFYFFSIKNQTITLKLVLGFTRIHKFAWYMDRILVIVVTGHIFSISISFFHLLMKPWLVCIIKHLGFTWNIVQMILLNKLTFLFTLMFVECFSHLKVSVVFEIRSMFAFW